MNDATNKFLGASLWVTLAVFVVRCAYSWVVLNGYIVGTISAFETGYNLISFAGESIAVSTFFMWIFNNWAWKCSWLNRIAGGMPVLSERYEGTITFVWEGREQHRTSTIKIKQTFLSISVTLTTNESSSASVTASIETIHNEENLVYIYLNTPKAELQDRSTIHYGTAVLCVEDPNRLTGNYYTSRLTRGSMDFIAVD